MSDITRSRVDKFLSGVASQPRRRGRLVFALDATASREETWDNACQLQASMFQEVAALGSLDVQLVYYRGPGDFGGECKASTWANDASQLGRLMARITCAAGHTQIGKVLKHVARETTLQKVDALAFVGDAMEEKADTLCHDASELARLGVPVFMFQEGHLLDVRRTFQDIARITNGAYCAFNTGAAEQLAQLLRAVATFAVGGTAALEASNNPAAVRLLGAGGR
jgi:hypothetical protein